MIILYIVWQDGSPRFWGESPARPMAEPPKSTDEVALSPFDAGEERLREALEHLLWESEHRISCERSPLPLPTRKLPRGLMPLPSKPFLADTLCAVRYGLEANAESISMRPWLVTLARLDWRQTLTVLGMCQERRIAERIFASNDLLECAAIYRFAGSLVARGLFLPGIVQKEPDSFLAQWLPVMDLNEQRRFMALSKPDTVHTQTQIGVLHALTDALVRQSLVTILSRAQAERGRYYSAHDAWMAALRGEESLIRWDDVGELQQLRDTIEAWQKPVTGGVTARFALGFRIEEPPHPGAYWLLRIMLGSPDGELAFPRSLAEAPPRVDEVWEHLLIALGQAVLLCPPLERAAVSADGLSCPLSREEAHGFFVRYAGLLEAAGYAVAKPEWWLRSGEQVLTLGAEVLPSEEPGVEGVEKTTQLKWQVMLDGVLVGAREIESLLAEESPLVFFHGRWVVVDPDQLREALRLLQRQPVQRMSAMQALKMVFGASKDGVRHPPLTTIGGSGWLSDVIERLGEQRPFTLLPTPEGFHGELRPYQARGFSWLVFLRELGLGGCLADDMGLGKTVQALALLLHEKKRGCCRTTLLAAPMSVLGNWMREAQRFAPGLRFYLHHGPERARGKAFKRAVSKYDVVVTSFTLLYRDYAELRQVAWAGIIVDEAQNIKNPGTRQAQAVRALSADYRVALTGTPMENHVGDLWAIMDFINPGMLGSRTTFRELFLRPIQSGVDPEARGRLRRMTAPFILRRLKTDREIIADLPQKSEARVVCSLTREQAQLYQAVLDDFREGLAGLSGISRQGHILAVLTRLKQVCNHPAQYLGEREAIAERSGKLARLEEMLEESLSSGESALVFTQYARMGELLRQRLCRVFAMESPFLHGGLSLKERDRIVAEFQNSAEPQVFILSLKAGGAGLNLTRATQVFHYDRWWNPAVENQATDRAFRIGQTRDVMVYKFICGGTLEERIDRMITDKIALAGEIVGSGETLLKRLSNNELEETLRLSLDDSLVME